MPYDILIATTCILSCGQFLNYGCHLYKSIRCELIVASLSLARLKMELGSLLTREPSKKGADPLVKQPPAPAFCLGVSGQFEFMYTARTSTLQSFSATIPVSSYSIVTYSEASINCHLLLNLLSIYHPGSVQY